MSAKEASFGATGLDPRLIRALNKRRFTEPTPVQAETIPRALEGKDVVARARTGSGKTLAYILPVLHRILTSGSDSSSWRALVLVPTRELCEQVKEEAVSVAVHCGGAITVTALGADLPEAARRAAFASAGSLVVATPARIAAALRDGCLPAVALQDTLQCLVLDEADLLLSYGYEDDISALAPHIPRGCQCLLMSATNSQDVQRLQKLVLHNPTVLDLVRLPAGRDAGRQEGPTEHIQQFQYFCATADERFLCAMALLKLSLVRKKVLLFVNTVDTAFRLRLFLEAFGVRSAVLDAALPLASRHNILQQFNKGLFDHLIATDSTHAAHHDAQGGEPPAVPSSSAPAARARAGRQGGGKGPRGGRGGERDGEFGVTRGIDFKGVRTVVNVDLPGSAQGYVHRIGRTGRAGQQGMAITLATPHTLPQLERLQRDLAQQQRTPTATEDENDEDDQDGERDSEEPQGVPTMPSFDRLKREALQALRYRGEDALRALTKSVVKEARLKDLKLEILNSQRLQEHFEEKPHELALLKHDKSLHQVQRHAHLKHLPAYVRASTNKGAGTSSTGGSTKLRFAAGRKPKRKRSDAGGDPIKGKGFVRKRVVEDDTLTEIEEAALQKAKQDEKAARKHERLLTKAAAQASKGNVRKHRSRKR